MRNSTVDEEEVEQHGLPLKWKNPKKRIPKKVLGILSSTIKNGDVDELSHRICPL